MDARKAKTRAAVKEAFLQIYPKTPLEKITVKELCNLAGINKSTFYCHYTDMYDLCDQLQNELVEEILEEIKNQPPSLDTGAEEFTKTLFRIMYANADRLRKLFSGREQEQFVGKLERVLKEIIYKAYPHYREDPEMQILLDFSIYGSYYAHERNLEVDREVFRNILQKITAILNPLYK